MIHFLNLMIATVIMEENVVGSCMLGDIGVEGHDVGTFFQRVQKIFIYIFTFGNVYIYIIYNIYYIYIIIYNVYYVYI